MQYKRNGNELITVSTDVSNERYDRIIIDSHNCYTIQILDTIQELINHFKDYDDEMDKAYQEEREEHKKALGITDDDEYDDYVSNLREVEDNDIW